MNEFKIGDTVKIKINKNSTCCFGITEQMLSFNNQICIITDLHKGTSIKYKNCDGYAYRIKPLHFNSTFNYTWSSNLMTKYPEDDCWND